MATATEAAAAPASVAPASAPASAAPGPGGFGPRGRRRRPKGAVREAILSLLAEGPANGYSLMKQIAERAEGEWSPSPGSVYPTLAQLVDEGLIEATGEGKGTDFALTPQGREYVEQNADALEAIWAGSTQGAPTRAAMRDSIGALMGVIQQFRFATDEQRTGGRRATRRDPPGPAPDPGRVDPKTGTPPPAAMQVGAFPCV